MAAAEVAAEVAAEADFAVWFGLGSMTATAGIDGSRRDPEQAYG